jgi:periplasmic divalent cation tolerance protein
VEQTGAESLTGGARRVEANRRRFHMDTPTGFAVILVTTASAEEADRIASSLVEERLAACVNVVGPIRSIYRWQGEVQRDEEHLLVIKANAAAFPRLQKRVGELHSYDTPEVIALPIIDASRKYLDWLQASTH